VAVFGDHGEEFGEHGGRFHCSSVHAEQVRVVFWLAGAGIPVGRFDQPVSTAALPATVLEALALPPAPTMIVPSLLPALRGTAPFPELAVSELRYEYRQSVGYTGARYRLVHDPVNRIEMLFDAERDPLEQHDLARERPVELERMRALARRWDERH
jgi:arylsulfatase A-like enzyme